MNTPKLKMASTSHLFLVLVLVFKPTKMGREVSCLFCVCEAMTALVTSYYWAIQAGLLTPLHRLSPLAAFTSGAYFLHNGRR